jgi:nitronate monooxygenase
MAGACPPALSIEVARAGGLAACGALLMSPDEIRAWADQVRPHGPFHINLWVPDPPPHRDVAAEQAVRAFLERFGPLVASEAGDATPPDFTAQCEAVIAAAPAVASSIMGLFPPELVSRLRAAGIAWCATATTVAEAVAAEAAGADHAGVGRAGRRARSPRARRRAGRALVERDAAAPEMISGASLGRSRRPVRCRCDTAPARRACRRGRHRARRRRSGRSAGSQTSARGRRASA